MAANNFPGPDSIRRHVLDNGITVLIYENADSSTVSIEGLVWAGAVNENRGNAGLANFTADLLMRGTHKRSFDEIFEELESVGAGVAFGGARHTSGFSGHGLVEDFDLILDVIDESLRRPTFPAEQIERLRGQIVTGLQMRPTTHARWPGCPIMKRPIRGIHIARRWAATSTVSAILIEPISSISTIVFMAPRI